MCHLRQILGPISGTSIVNLFKIQSLHLRKIPFLSLKTHATWLLDPKIRCN